MSQLLHLGEVVSRNARLFPNKLGARDLARSLTYRQWNERSCRLANALLGMGLAKGDRVAILAYNCVEWLEIYVALAKAGLVAVPINFRLVGSEIRYIVDDAEARAFIVQDDLVDRVEADPFRPCHSPGQLSSTSAARRRRRGIGPTRRSSSAPRRANRRCRFSPRTPGRSCTPRGPPANPKAPSAATRIARSWR